MLENKSPKPNCGQPPIAMKNREEFFMRTPCRSIDKKSRNNTIQMSASVNAIKLSP